MNTFIFDFDGTIADTLPAIFYAFQKIFKDFENREVSLEDIKLMFGPTEEGIIKANFSDQKNIETAIHKFYQIYRNHHTEFVQYSMEIEGLLKGLKDKNYKLAIVTGKGRKCFEISMEALGLDSYFDMVITGDDVENAKPHPEGILKILEDLNVKKSEAMFIGDSNADIEAGKRAGVLTIGVQWLSESQTKDFSLIPDHLFLSVKEFEQYLECSVMRR